MARPETHPEQGDEAAADVARPGTGVVRPGTGVVQPAGAAKARAVVPEPGEAPAGPIHVVLPVIPVKPAKQGFLDKLIAPKGKKKKDHSEVPVSPAPAPPVAPAPPEHDEATQSAPPALPKAQSAPPAPPTARAAAPAPPPAPAPVRFEPVPLPEQVEFPEPPVEAAAAPAPAPPPPPPPPPAPPSDVRRPDTRPASGQARPTEPAPRPVEPPPPPPPPPPRPVEQARPAPVEPPRPVDQPRPVERPVEQPRPDIWPANKQPQPRPDTRPELRAQPQVARPPARPPAPPRTAPLAHPSDSSPYPDEEYYEEEPRPQRRVQPAPRRRLAEAVPDEPKPLRRGLLVAAAVVVVLVGGVVGAAVGRTAEPGTRWMANFGGGAPVATLGTLGTDAPRPSQAALQSRLASLLGDSRLGGHVTASVVDVATGDPLYEFNGGGTAEPASTTKLATAAAVLSTRGPTYQIETRVVAGPNPGEVIIIGGGDPTLAAGANGTYPGAARLDKLAEQVKAALGGTAPTRVIVDSSLFSGSTLGPGWYPEDAKDGFTANITALMTDGARKNPKATKQAFRYEQPDLAAGQQFAKALGLPASAVTVQPGGSGGQELGKVLSPPLGRIVEMMLLESDNVIAELLARQVAIARGLPASFEGGAEATRDALHDLGLPVDGYGLVDGSGLSHQNHLAASLLTGILAAAASPEHPQLRPILSGLPVAAYSGTLNDRYRTANTGASAAGTVRAKTGTLNGVSTLAGIAVDADGRLLAFSVLADAVSNTYSAQLALDRVAAAIASCGC